MGLTNINSKRRVKFDMFGGFTDGLQIAPSVHEASVAGNKLFPYVGTGGAAVPISHGGAETHYY